MARAYLAPSWFMKDVANRITTLFGSPILQVKGRRSGSLQTIPINVLDHEGERYLVAPRGETDWVRNVRAAGTATLKTRRRAQEIGLVELETEDKPKLIAAYREKWDRPTKGQWLALPDPADHPIFRIVEPGSET